MHDKQGYFPPQLSHDFVVMVLLFMRANICQIVNSILNTVILTNMPTKISFINHLIKFSGGLVFHLYTVTDNMIHIVFQLI